jgi:hypothetical protein
MIGSTQKWWGVAALALLCIAPCAFASSSLTMTGAGNNVMDGVYVGPYYATVNGAANTPVICDDFADETYIGSSWNYTPNTFSTLGNALWGNQTKNYEGAAWLTLQMLSLNGNPANATQVGYLSYAIWSLFDGAALNGLRRLLAGPDSVELNGRSILKLCDSDATRLHEWARIVSGAGIHDHGTGRRFRGNVSTVRSVVMCGCDTVPTSRAKCGGGFQYCLNAELRPSPF